MAYVPQEYPASRPGIPTLVVSIAAVILFVAVIYWTELKSLFGV
ncbi:MAG TPA: hypothetical protein VL966_11895 [Alphaproteobacteria bacterium]|jgi:hypothetical protein|nr:hypothetical protein [Alphaproteobacteria bacterium]